MAAVGCGGGRTPAPVTAGGPRGTPTASAIELPADVAFERAVSRGTRTMRGAPGPKYWQQWTDYQLQAELNPISKRLTGQGSLTYHNRSPDALEEVYVQLLHNLFAPGARHNTDVPWSVEGVGLSRVAAQGQALKPVKNGGVGYEVDGTVMRIRLPRPIPAGGSATLEFSWKLRIPPDGAPRGGQDGETYFISYWYPQMAVYDDVNGWQIDQYLGNAEFYMGYGNYDVALTLPEGWLVTSTGALTNPEEVLSAQTRARLDSAAHSTGIVRVVGEADRKAGTSTAQGTGGKLTWRFRADSVRDVSWGASSKFLWDATNAAVGDANGDGRPDTAAVHAFYRPELRASHWDQSARYSRHSVEFFSRYLLPYPYPHMTAVDGPTSCGGMEYPMMTCIGGQWDTLGLYEVTTHEIGHMWFPMLVGSDEKRYAWMDEGLTQFDQSQAMADFFKGFDDEERNRGNYLGFAEGGGEVELIHHGDRYPTYGAYGVASYYKPATVLVALRGVLGAETFNKAYPGIRPPLALQASRSARPVQHLRGCCRPGPVVVLAELALRDLEAGPGHRHRRPGGRLAGSGHRKPGTGSHAGSPGGHPNRGTGGHVDHSRECLVHGERRWPIRVAREPAVKSIEIDPRRDFPDIDRSNQIWPR